MCALFYFKHFVFQNTLVLARKDFAFHKRETTPSGFVRNALFSSGIRELSHQDQRSRVEGHRDKATASPLSAEISMHDRAASVKIV